MNSFFSSFFFPALSSTDATGEKSVAPEQYADGISRDQNEER